MKAVTWHGKRDVRVETVPDPVLQEPTDAVIKVTSTGICGSDLHLYEVLGSFLDVGDVLGHEAMGIVQEVGAEVTGIKPGDRVVVPFNISCGHCFHMRPGLAVAVRDHPGARARRGPAGRAVRLPVGCGADRVQAVEYAAIPPGGSGAVFGLGPIGQMCCRIARHRGAEQVICVDLVTERLALAAKYGAVPIDPGRPAENAAAIRDVTDGRGPDAVIDAAGMEAHGSPVGRLAHQFTGCCSRGWPPR